MEEKEIWAIMIVIAVAVAVAVAVGAYFIFSGSGSHQRVVDSMQIMDLTKGFVLEVEMVDVKTMAWLSLGPLDVDFAEGESYSQSCWIWKNPVGDVDYAMTIWGPDESGSGYYVELARLCGREMRIVYTEGTTEGTITSTIDVAAVTDWSSQVHDGYTVLLIHLED